MGVTNLLPQLKEIQVQISLTDYKGKTLAVDAYGWLHRGLILCSQDLCQDRPTQGYITSVMKKIDMLRYFGVEPYLVFDGASLPTKEGTALERREKRRVAKDAANNFLKVGNRKAAWKEFMKAAGVTPEMAKAIMMELDRKRVKYVVAPYEADPQMVYLEKIGLVDGILSEDSDLLVFGCRKLITKLNDYGECVEIDRANLHKLKTEYHRFTPEQWRSLAILSGCDYTKGIAGVGMKTAYNIVLKHGTWEAICAALEAEKKPVSAEFLEEAFKANLAFQFSKVFDPVTGCAATLNEYPSNFAIDMQVVESCCGRSQSPEIQTGVCLGKLHPSTHQVLYSRELFLKRGPLPKAPPKIVEKVTASSASRTIESFFSVQKQATSTIQLLKSVKNQVDRTIKLSPNAKKLKRLTPITNNCVPVSSKFFGSQNAKIAPLKENLTQIEMPKPVESSYEKPFEAQSSFLTGDSDIPDESSSPIKDVAPGERVVNYLTDDDDDNDSCLSGTNSMANSIVDRPLFSSTLTKSSTELESEADEGYENEIEESPIKFTVSSWRSQFLMKESAELVQTSTAAKLKVERAVKTKKVIETETKPTKDSAAAALVSQEFLQPSQLSESDADLSFTKTPKKTLAFGLLRFAFTG